VLLDDADKRKPVPGLSNKGWQVVVVNYTNTSDLQFKLAGVDTVISTVSGEAQLKLIEAASSARVRRFVPAEFGGPPALRAADDPLDNDRRRALLRLAQLEVTGMRFCVFTCGIFYERFAPGGLAQSQLGFSSGISGEGAYLMDFRRLVARLPHDDDEGRPAKVSMISVKDLAHYVVASLALSPWPREFRVRGDRMNIRELVALAESMRGQSKPPGVETVHPLLIWHPGRTFDTQQYPRSSLVAAEEQARTSRNRSRELQLHHLITTAAGHWDFSEDNLSERVDVEVERFRAYLARVWTNP
jgi:hypothetical protein